MVLNPEIASVVTGSLGLFLVALDSTPAVISIARRFRDKTTSNWHHGSQKKRVRYHDEDGEASKKSVMGFSDNWQRFGIALFSELGLLVSLPLAIISSLNGGRDGYLVQSWLQVATWVLLTIQAVAFFTEPLNTERFKLSCYAFWASILTISIPCIEIGLSWSAGRVSSLTTPSIGLLIGQVAIAFLRGICCTMIPRRPDVFWNGKLVDQEFTASIFSRFTFSWVNELMKYTAQKRCVGIEDLPELPFAARPGNLRARFEQARKGRKLWKALIVAHYRPILVQLMLTLFSCVLSFGPQMALYGILKSLETRGMELGDSSASWLWVVGLGGLMVLSSSIDSWLYWIIYSQIGIPVYEELAATIFAKSMRRKDVKEMQQSNGGGHSNSDSSEPLIDDGEEENDEEEDLEKSRQSVINYAAVDSKRIADFATYNYLIPSAILKLLMACFFLASLIGFWSLLAGLAVSAIVLPVNARLAKRYANSQDLLMKLRDQKIAVVTEVLQGIRQIKFSALEEQWQNRISEKRNIELDSLWTSFLYSTALVSLWILGPLMLSAASLTAYVFIHGELTASVAFTAMSIFGSLELSMASLPDLLSRVLEAKISSDRIEKYMDSPEKTPNILPGNQISFENASVAWPADGQGDWDDGKRFVLQNMDLAFPLRGLSVVSGRTGSGKSLLLASILGECDVIGGTIRAPVSPSIGDRYDHLATGANWVIDSAIAYVAQIPWIENATIKDNILFGLPFNPARYCKVLFASGLEKDLDMLPDGELTDIGANGVNLSGGQRWRITLARAFYSRAGILILDDIFSALDTHTGRHVYEHGLTGEICKNRTRILVTHHVSLCMPQTDYSVLLENGGVKYAGTIEELRRTNSLEDIILQGRIAELEGLVELEAREPEQPLPVTPQNKRYSQSSKRTSIISNRNSILSKRSSTYSKRSSTFSKRSSTFSNQSYAFSQGSSAFTSNEEVSDDIRVKKFVQEESRGTGSIPLSVYTTYLKKGGKAWIWALVLMTYVTYASLMVIRSWWVSVWTSSADDDKQPCPVLTVMDQVNRPIVAQEDDNLPLYLGVYVGISLAGCVIGCVKYYLLMCVSIQASRNLFNDLMQTVLRAPLRWLDTVPLGRIVNRLTSDIYMVDVRLGYDAGFFTLKALEIVGILIAGAFVSPLVIIFAIALLALCLKLSMTYLTAARELKRLESSAKSPIFEQFGSSLCGLITIRAFSKTDNYVSIMYSKISRHAQASWNLWLFNRWLDFRMNLVGALFATVTAGLVIYVPSISASLAGFALGFALQYNSAVTMVLRQYANLELDMNATERVIEYSNIETESQEGASAPAAWPTEGRIEVEDLVVGYAPGLPPVLNGLSFTAEKNQRVGVVGRTGAGKSSLTLALFRFLEAREGRISIDGVDVSKIKLHDLRSRLAIIPQDPVLFSGTIRSNLDPFSEHTDTELYDALERVNLAFFEDTETLASSWTAPGHMTRTTTPMSTAETLGSINPENPKDNGGLFSCLSSSVSEGGLNFSQGQRQLLCLARAIVARPKIMVLDEATSAVDMETDAMIQRSIRAEFGHNATTLLVIAHRLSTIADFDRILVMDAGKAVEFGSPQDLMAIEGGVFKNLVENSGERDIVEGMIMGDRSDLV
ncbi:hypothetical protein MW887_010657 [Aspergillus wentii]|nr:hypothetical protein MW887_010657 [Aspergillus wentii]